MTILVLFCFHTSVFAQKNCQYQKTENGVKVYTCETEKSPYHGVKAEFSVNCSMEEYENFLLDWSRFTEWKYRVASSVLVEEVSPNELICYTTIDSPWPVNDRDMVEHLVLTRDTLTQEVTMHITVKNDYLPKEDGYVRIPESNSTLKLRPGENNTVIAEYYIEANPGGAVPSWVVNMVSIYGPIETFGTVRELLNNNGETQ